jgi:hypothetical protein
LKLISVFDIWFNAPFNMGRFLLDRVCTKHVEYCMLYYLKLTLIHVAMLRSVKGPAVKTTSWLNWAVRMYRFFLWVMLRSHHMLSYGPKRTFMLWNSQDFTIQFSIPVYDDWKLPNWFCGLFWWIEWFKRKVYMTCIIFLNIKILNTYTHDYVVHSKHL